MKRFISILLLLITVLNVASCGAEEQKAAEANGNAAISNDSTVTANQSEETKGHLSLGTENLMSSIIPNKVTAVNDFSGYGERITDFGLRLFKGSHKSGENTLISPLSVLCALAMTSNGAEGDTLAEMEKVLGMSKEELNLFIYSYMNALPLGEGYKLKLANSVWFTSDTGFTVNDDFLQTNADYYGADIFKAPFNSDTVDDINGWVNDKTEGMIPTIIDDIPPSAVMYLINALVFEAEWYDQYSEYQVRDTVFTKEDGSKQDVKLMYGDEGKYLKDDNATGFIKYYRGGKYAFAALLPNEGVSVDEYLASLDGVHLYEMLSAPENISVLSAIPKFETKTDTEISAVLKSMGMPTAFAENAADFSSLGHSTAGNVFINRVLHKTFISVGEKGTKAGAATVVTMVPTGCVPDNTKKVYLDRPFVYMLIDCTTNTPFFIGTLMDVAE